MENLLFEIRRKLVHLCTVIYILIYYLLDKFYSQRGALFILLFILIIFSFIEFLKIRYNKKIPLFHRLYREDESNSFSGNIFLIMGVIISFAIFQFNIAATAILMMVFGDSASAIIGRMGKNKIDHINRSWEGILSEFVIDVLVGFIFLTSIPIIMIMALSATITETLLSSIDDNLAIPIVSGFAGQSFSLIIRILNL